MSRNKREGVYMGKMWNRHERAGKTYISRPMRSLVSCLNGPDNRTQRKGIQRYLKELEE